MPVFNPTKVAEEEYQGTDHTAVNNPKAGDYTLETGNINWFYDGTSWARRSPIHWGTYPADGGGFADAVSFVTSLYPANLPFIQGDVIAFTQDLGPMGSMSATGMFSGTVFEGISGEDSTAALFGLQSEITSVNDRITTEVTTINDSFSNVIDNLNLYLPYSGSDYTLLSGTENAGMFTIEADRLWFFNGTAWGQTPYMTGSNLEIGEGATTTGEDAISIGRSTTATSSTNYAAVAIGVGCIATEENVAIGSGNNVTGTAFRNTAIGSSNYIIGTSGGVFISGSDSSATNSSFSGIIGLGSLNSCYSCLSVGYQASQATSSYSLVVGEVSYNLNGSSSVLVGSSITNSGSNNLLVGDIIDCTKSNCLALGRFADVYIHGSQVHSISTTNSATGGAQSLSLLLVGSSVGTAPLVLTSTPETPTPTAGNQLYCKTGQAKTFTGKVLASLSPQVSGGGGISGTFQGRLVNFNGLLRLDWYSLDLFYNPDGCTFTATLNQTLKTLTFTFTGVGSTEVYNVIVSIDCVELVC